MLQKIINNFYLRNIVILLIFISPDIFQNIAMHEGVEGQKLLDLAFNRSAFYCYIVFHNRVLYEYFLKKKKYILYVIVFLVTLLICRETIGYLSWLMSSPTTNTSYSVEEIIGYNWAYFIFIYWANIVYMYIGLGVYIAYKTFKDRERLLQIENEKKTLELKYLNEQLNPHFLFNALNNIYNHMLHNSVSCNELILKLSELLRYIIDSSKKEKVPIIQEIDFIEHYIAFQRERLGDRCTVIYEKQLGGSMLHVVPMILFNFIENAFKHGTRSINQTKVVIKITVENNVLSLYVSNDTYKQEMEYSTLIGMKNTRQRLELLYPDRYDLDITEMENKYNVSLIIRGLR